GARGERRYQSRVRGAILLRRRARRRTTHLGNHMHPWTCAQLIRAFVTLVAVGSLGGCQRDASSQLGAAEQASVKAEIDALRSAYEAAVAAGNPAELT